MVGFGRVQKALVVSGFIPGVLGLRSSVLV